MHNKPNEKGEHTMKYRVIKVDNKGTETDFGIMCEDDMKMTVKGYKQDDTIENFYTRKGSQTFYIVDKQ